MPPSTSSASEAAPQASALLRGLGITPTAARVSVLQALWRGAASGPLTARDIYLWLHAAHQPAALGTIERALGLLHACGLAVRSFTQEGRAAFAPQASAQ